MTVWSPASTADKKTKANIVEINGDPTDNNAALFKQGYVEALKPKFDSGDYKMVGDQTGKWDATVAQTTFEQIFTQNKGKVDGVISANDTMAGGIVTVLKNNKLAGKVPVTGQDASDEGLQRVIAGTQCGTVFKDVNLEADAAAKLAVADAEERRLGRRPGERYGHRHPGEQGRQVGLRHPGVGDAGEHQGAVRRRLHHRGQGVHRPTSRRHCTKLGLS